MLQECKTADDVFQNRVRVIERLRSIQPVHDSGINLRRGKYGGRRGSDPEFVPPVEPLPPDYPNKLTPIWISAPELAFVFESPAPPLPQVLPPRLTIPDIQRAVVNYFRDRGNDFSRVDLLSERRTQVIVWPRQIAMYLAKTSTTRSLPAIGHAFGGRDHTTALHAVRKVQDRINSGHADTITIINELRALLKVES